MRVITNGIKESIKVGEPLDLDPIARRFNRLREPMRILLRTLLICLLAPAAVALAQDNKPQARANANPLTSASKLLYQGGQMMILLSAQKVPEEYYSFRPTEAVRSFGQIVGHVADSQYLYCSIVLGEKNPAPDIEKAKPRRLI